MQTLYETIRTDKMNAIKQRQTVAKSILTTLLGELESHAKRSGDAVEDSFVMRLIKKFIEANNDSLKYKEDPVLRQENEILSGYLPEQMSDDTLRGIIESLDTKNIGQIMGYLNEHYDGKYNRSVAASIAKSL